MTESNAIASQTIVEGRILELRTLRGVRGGKSGDVATAEAAFKRVAEKEELIDTLVRVMSGPTVHRSVAEDAKRKITDLRAEIQAEYDDLIAKLELQEALKELGLY